MTHARPSKALVFIVAAGGTEDAARDARSVAAEIAVAPPAGSPCEIRELPGVIWGVRTGEDHGGHRLSRAVRGDREAILFGDPLWREPVSSRPRSAAELLLRWEAEGRDVLALLDNHFLLVIADQATGELQVATDRIGGVRLYATAVRGTTVLCNSYLLASRLADDKRIDGQALAAFFHLGFFPGTRTALRGVCLHPAATLTRIARGFFRTEPYWQPAMSIDRSRGRQATLDRGVDAFNAAVREGAVDSDKSYLSLTAGIDSRAVACALLHEKIPFAAYTHGYPGCLEGKIVSRLVKHQGIEHRFVALADGFASRLRELALASFAATEGEVSSIEKSHLSHVFTALREAAPAGKTALFTGGCGSILKGMYYRFLQDEDPHRPESVDRLIGWNFWQRLPDIFAPAIPARDPRILRDTISAILDEAPGGSFFQRLDYLYLVKYRRWGGAVNEIYRRFFPVRDPFASLAVLDYLFAVDPRIKKARLPHYAVMSRDFPALQRELGNNMSPPIPFNLRNLPRFFPSVPWRIQQVLRGFSRKFLPRELFPHVDYVDYTRWIRGGSGRSLVEEILRPGSMKSAFLYDERKLDAFFTAQREQGFSAFPLIDKMCTLELYFREVHGS